ncbi:Two component, sigma54 specific, transcriptional regulator, Fis family [Candidatus Sulfotelmatobacter kueseliae]|uniref:Two component, sigma54 specific, transcriptional regulator, Fis family n=1 Tax=Candidatus Sulfotelmatobacter kueseliae TaxID=2042962 RepID=A0A2U3KKQ5_9BACT|nr:Two component, sigma54 specific, transcriptional regulator, Fis family [Candidatus Sulfotelmatobacter kueseliae]
MAENATETLRLLVVSRESAVLRPLWSMPESSSWQIETAASAWDAIERVQSGVAPHLLLLDLPRGDGDSLHILRWLRRLRPDLPVIVTCSPEDADKKKEATRLGAQEVLIRPFEEAELESAIRQHLLLPGNERSEAVSEDIEHLGPDTFFVSASPVTQKLRAQAELLAEADVPVLILGESGSGKDTLARLIHKLSVRSGFPFLKAKCADMPAELLEAELLGSEQTSSQRTIVTQGKLEHAEKGTIFLDEIAEMPLTLQAKLMQVLQEGVFARPGSGRTVPVDVHLLAASSANMDRAIAEKRLREDLYYRLSAFTVQVPPLRQRKEEITILLQHLMHKLSRHYGLPPRKFSPAVLAACRDHAWPDNVRELETFVKRYLLAGDRGLTLGAASNGADRMNGVQASGSKGATPFVGADDVQQEQSGPTSLKSLIDSVKCEAERNAIGTALEKTGWNRKAAARLLQVSYRTLLYKIDQYHMRVSKSGVLSVAETRPAGFGSEAKQNGRAS